MGSTEYNQEAVERAHLAMCDYQSRYNKMMKEKENKTAIESLEQIDPNKMYVKFTVPTRDIEVIVITAQPTDAFNICGWLVNAFKKMDVEPKTTARFPDAYKFEVLL